MLTVTDSFYPSNMLANLLLCTPFYFHMTYYVSMTMSILWCSEHGCLERTLSHMEPMWVTCGSMGFEIATRTHTHGHPHPQPMVGTHTHAVHYSHLLIPFLQPFDSFSKVSSVTFDLLGPYTHLTAMFDTSTSPFGLLVSPLAHTNHSPLSSSPCASGKFLFAFSLC